jgi:nitrogen fixation/metabolism regulation signal transduction histidine kinase
LHVSIFSLEGKLLKTSIENAFEKTDNTPLDKKTLSELANNSNQRILKTKMEDGVTYQSSYSYINDAKFKRIGILQLQFTQDNSEVEYELKEFLFRLAIVYTFMLLLAIALAYFLSSYITRSIKNIADKMKQTGLNKRNEKIILNTASYEIDTLVDSYNKMIDELEESAVKLAQSEREQAWREMAKQVAHEIKNPLTPMRLTVQSFERKFDVKDPDIKNKLKEYSDTLIQQIDVMSSIASAFSDFAKMPTQKREKLEVVSVVKLAIEIFNEKYIHFISKEKEIDANLDKTQLIRIVTNLVKNASQAVKQEENPLVEVIVSSENENIKIVISDNGKGIPKELEELIFEPKFTTKSSGMGLGLGIIKNIIEAYDGTISFKSKEGIGTVFTVILPKK